MSLIKPFRGLRPVAGRSDDVAAPPYDVVDRGEAKALAEGRPWSFLHISRPEIDLPDSTDPYDPAVYAKGRENLDRMIAEGVLEAVKAVSLDVPLVVRLEGTNVERGRQLLDESDLTIITAANMTDAARKAVEAAS